MSKTKKQKATKKKKKLQSGLRSSQQVTFICLQCNMKEEIPKQVVRQLDAMDGGEAS